jgi:hypothetical protein
MFQIFEWRAMFYLVKSQSKRKIEEIMYDHNHENMQDNYTSL